MKIRTEKFTNLVRCCEVKLFDAQMIVRNKACSITDACMVNDEDMTLMEAEVFNVRLISPGLDFGSDENYEKWIIEVQAQKIGEITVAIGVSGRRKRLSTYVARIFVNPNERGKGWGSKAYHKLASHYGEIRSDVPTARSSEALKLWDRIGSYGVVSTGQFSLKG
ncbi:MAG: hypothetical protein EOP04_03655 [Proteobacteria bacterium]|nr:MAG: hypothetical protein EOP04_03655 [Pseudomonadota bacterium]